MYVDSFSETALDNGLVLATDSDNSIVNNPGVVRVTAYGENVDEVAGSGCVDSRIRELIALLKIPQENIKIDHDKSLFLQP